MVFMRSEYKILGPFAIVLFILLFYFLGWKTALAFAVGAILFLFWLVIIVPRDMARERGREEVAWIVVSLVGSPFLAIFLLWVLGPVAESGD